MVTKRRARAVLAVSTVVAAFTLLAGCTPVGSPALRQIPNDPRVFDNSDPGVLVDGGKVYLFGTSNNKHLPVRQISSFTSSLATSQQDWAKNPHDAMPTRPAWVRASAWRIWAPSPIKIGSTYYVYFAGPNAAATTNFNNDQCIGRAAASAPMGPYTPEATPLYCGLPPEGPVGGQPASNPFGRGALDPHVFRANDGQRYLVMALSRTKGNIGVVRLDSNGRVPGGRNATPTILASQSFPWHDGTDDSTMTSAAFLENPSMSYDPATKTYLLFYSAGQYYTARYNTGFARCAHPTGPCTLDSRGPFLKSGNGRTGTGGLTVFTSPNGTRMVAYASWTSGHENESGSVGQYSRQTHWARLLVNDTTDPAKQTLKLGALG